MSSLVRLTNLESISMEALDVKGEMYDYAPGVLYLGSLPKLEHFDFSGYLSCPPVARKLTSLIWNPDVGDVELDDSAASFWIEAEPKLESLREFNFESWNQQPEEVRTIVTEIIAGTASSLTSLHLDVPDIVWHDDFISACTNLKRLSIPDPYLVDCNHERDYQAWDPINEDRFQSLPTFTNLTNLLFNYNSAGCDLLNSVQIIRCLTNLERLDLVPWTFKATEEPARGGVLPKLTHLCIVPMNICDDSLSDDSSDDSSNEEVMAVDAKESFQGGFPSLKRLFIQYLPVCSGEYGGYRSETWHCLASMAPNVECIGMDGRVAWTSGAIKLSDVPFDSSKRSSPPNKGISCDLQNISQSFSKLKRLELEWDYFNSYPKPKYVLGPPEIAKAKTAPGDLTFEELEFKK